MDEVFESGQWPYGPRSHDVGWMWMFDMAVVGSMLDCRPGDRVLDLGAGSGFSTETLVRFGYRVVPLDPDPVALARGRRRLEVDRRLSPSRSTPVTGVAQHLPFADGSFQGVVGMNMLHHVQDLEAALGELARVLAPGGRAAFSEPGTRHLESPQTARARREWGEDDLPLDVHEVAEIAWRRGFQRVELRPLPHPGLCPVEVRELGDFEAGVHPTLWNRHEGMARYMVEYHPLFVLVREGERPRDSRHPGVLTCALAVAEPPSRARPGECLRVRVRAVNDGDTRWLAGPLEGGGHVSFGVKLLRPDGRVVTDRLGRTPLPHDVLPGEEVEATLEIRLPEDLPGGAYGLSFDMVNEWMAWFSDAELEPLPAHPLEVAGARAGP